MAVPYHSMSQSEIEEFLRPPRFAVFGTTRKDGSPQQSPVWFLYEDGKLFVSITEGSIKHRHLLRDPRLNICIPGTHPDARAVMMRGVAEIFPEGQENWVDDIAWKIVRRYYESDEDAQAYIDSVADTGQSMLVVLAPERVIAQDYTEDTK